MKLSTLVVLCAGLCAAVSGAQTRSLITQKIDDTQLVTLRGDVHPLARPQYDRGLAPDSFMLRHLRILLKRAPEQEQAVERFIDQLHDPASPSYHRWLTPRETGQRFGVAQQDIDAIVMWLGAHGFQVDQVYPSRTMIEFSGAAAQVREAFHTEIHRYFVKGQEHWAVSTDPRIPGALAPAVAGIAKLNDFEPHPAYHEGGRVRRSDGGKWQAANPVADATVSFSGNDYYLVAPYDFATIYNLLPLWNASVTGQGQTIALVEDSNINPADVAAFRAGLGLPALQPTQLQIVCATAPTCATTADETEGAIDAEWSAAVAPAATILYVAADTIEDSATYIVNNTKASVVSISFSACESDLGTSGNAFWASLWATAASQGQTVVAAAGDAGGAVCDSDLNPMALYATHGLSVNGIASTPSNVAVGGTDFSDTFAGTNSAYWSSTNSSQTMQSALSYVPEMSWNNSCASSVFDAFVDFPQGEAYCELGFPFFFVGTNPLNPLNIVAGSGGPSSVNVKPTWQANVAGLMNDGLRDLPDVSLFASDNAWNHAYIYCMSDAAENGNPCDYTNPADTVYNSGGGTSFAAPAFAGIMALIGQYTGSSQGNANYELYTLAGDEYGTPATPNTEALGVCNAGQGNQASGTCLFYDVTMGDTAVPCGTGSPNCYTVSAGDKQGVLSTSTSSLVPAYPAGAGWDFATGLGSVNIANLVDGWTTSKQDYVIAGQVTLNGAALKGVAVSLTGGHTAAAVTNSSGKYSFVVPGSQAYQVTPSLSGYAFDPPNQSIPNLGANRTANFTGSVAGVAFLSTNSVAFGNQNAGTTSAAQEVVLTNTGAGSLALASVSIVGPNKRDFTWTSECGTIPAQIASNATCTIQLAFDPSVAGAETATLTFTDNSNGTAGSTQTVSLTGTGLVSMTIAPTSVSFGYAGVNMPSATRSVQISNTSAIAVAISNIAVTGTNVGDFKPTGNCHASLAAGAKCVVTLVFEPAAAGARSAALSITDGATGSPQSVALSGIGTEKAVIELSKSSLTFPATSVGGTSAAQVVTVTNGGHASLTISGVSAGGDFAETNTCTAALGAGASCTVSVTFTPTQTGISTGTLTVTGTGVVTSQQVRLTGTGE